MGPRAGLVDLEREKSLATVGNRTAVPLLCSLQPVEGTDVLNCCENVGRHLMDAFRALHVTRTTNSGVNKATFVMRTLFM